MRIKKYFTCGTLGAIAACVTIGGFALMQINDNETSLFKGNYDSTFVAFAEESSATLESPMLKSKYMISTDERYMLVVTAFNADVNAYNAIGYQYSVDGKTEVTKESGTYYTGVSLLNTDSKRTEYTIGQIYPNVTANAMIVMEIEYSIFSDYNITPYMTPKESQTVSGTEVTMERRYTFIGAAPTSHAINDDGSYTATATVNVSGGILMNSSDIAGKNWTAAVNVKTKPISQWNTYGIAIKYDTGKYLILGASQRDKSLLRVGSLPNGDWKDDFDPAIDPTNPNAITDVRNSYLSKDNLNVKVTYYGGQYYVYFNDFLYNVFSAKDLGVDDTYGNPVSVGFGYRLDHGLPQTATFSDWTYCVEDDANFRNPKVDAKNILTTVGGVPASQEINEDGSYTATVATNGMSGGLLMNSSDIAGKSWIAEVNVKKDTISQWNIYGIAIKYNTGNYLILGASQRGSDSLLKVAARVGDTWIGDFEDSNNAGAITAERGAYLTKAYLNVKVLFKDGSYSVYLNDVLFAKLSASQLGVGTYGTPVSVGFGYRLDSGLPQTATFSDWAYCVSVGGVPTSQVINEDGSYTATAEKGMSGGLLMNSSDIAGKSWIAEVNVKKDTISLWNIYGIAIKYGDGNYLILGASQRGSDSLLKVAARVGDTWIGDFEDSNNAGAITAERGAYLTKAYLNVKVLFKDGSYSVYLNDVLFAKLSASQLGVSSYGTPVSVGFGYRLDAGLPKTATFSDWTYCVEGDAKYSEFLLKHQS